MRIASLTLVAVLCLGSLGVTDVYAGIFGCRRGRQQSCCPVPKSSSSSEAQIQVLRGQVSDLQQRVLQLEARQN
jgi:hypothetical protein